METLATAQPAVFAVFARKVSQRDYEATRSQVCRIQTKEVIPYEQPIACNPILFQVMP